MGWPVGGALSGSVLSVTVIPAALLFPPSGANAAEGPGVRGANGCGCPLRCYSVSRR